MQESDAKMSVLLSMLVSIFKKFRNKRYSVSAPCKMVQFYTVKKTIRVKTVTNLDQLAAEPNCHEPCVEERVTKLPILNKFE